MTAFSDSSLVTDPTTGLQTTFGSLSADSQQQVIAVDQTTTTEVQGTTSTQPSVPISGNDPNSAYLSTTDTTAPAAGTSAAGDYAPNYSVSAYSDVTNSIGGAQATTDTSTTAPSYAGGYYGDQTLSSGGGYDPNNPSAYTDSANSIGGAAAVTDTTAVGPSYAGGYVPGAVESTGGGYDPNNPSAYTDPANSIGGDAAVTDTAAIGPSFAGGYYGDQTEASGGGYDPSATNTAFDIQDPSISRRAASGLFPGGSASGGPIAPVINFLTGGGFGPASGSDTDWRVRLSLAANGPQIFYKDSSNALMAPLQATNGVIWPYTPQINITHQANYSPMTPVHSNYPQNFYTNSDVSEINISGDFTVQNISEGKYLLAAIYFFRAATKMFFGSGDNVGNPPPILFLDGYGSHYFPHVPCVVTSFNHVMGNEVDYIEIPLQNTVSVNTNQNSTVATNGAVNFLDNAGMQNIPSLLQSALSPVQSITKRPISTITRVPTVSQIQVTVKPMYSRKNLHDRFNLNDFAAGRLLQDAMSGYGGFI
jgi:hypothetical protein